MKRLSASQYAEVLSQSWKRAKPNQRWQVVRNGILLVSRHRAGKLWPRIFAHLRRLEDQAAGLTRVTLTTARSINQAEWAARLQKYLGQVTVDAILDPPLRGGWQLRHGDTFIDSSIATRLKRLQTHWSQT
ncbi:MAG: F0F1 ATP synthase subunit delta [Candidatus Kerfeldbacteria bacterium]|nr:F0F1 ATP synthase subunit delta [Candidatus Kerfeldbacteria bacterium]